MRMLLQLLVGVAVAAGREVGVAELGDSNPVDCVLGEWSNYGACSDKCGGGRQSRSRAVLQPPQQGGECAQTEEDRICNSEACEDGLLAQDLQDLDQPGTYNYRLLFSTD